MRLYLVRHVHAVPEEENVRRLVVGKGKPPVFEFKKGAVLCLEHTGAGWHIRWYFSPEMLASTATSGVAEFS